MSDVALQDESAVEVEAVRSNGPARSDQPASASGRLARRYGAASSNQRGLVTVEFIFGIILVIAIITVVVSVIHNPSVGSLFVQLVSWLLGLIKGVTP